MNNYRITSFATTSPVTLDDVRDHLQLYGDESYDAYLEALIFSAQEVVSGILGEPVDTTGIQAWYGNYENIELPHQYIVNNAITSVQFYDTDEVLQTVADTIYFVDFSRRFPRVILRQNQQWPQGMSTAREFPVIVNYSAAISPQAGADLEHAILMICEDLFSNRASASDKPSTKVYLTAEQLLKRYRRIQW